jgi:hypothetical protein
MEPRLPLALVMVCTACAVGASAERQHEDAVLRDQLVKVQEAACVRPTSAPSCAPDLRLSWEQPRAGRIEMWCAEDGKAYVKGARVDGEAPPAVWNAVERVVQASEGCVTTYGARVSVTSKTLPQACADPRFDIHELLELALDAAEEGPTPTPRVAPPPSTKCPPFTGPLWPAAR